MTIDIMSRLEQAVRIALSEHVFIENEQSRNRVFENIQEAVCDDERCSQENNTSYQDAVATFKKLLNPVVLDRDGQPAVNEIWTDARFILPVIAASAQLYDRMIDPNNDSALTVSVQPSSQSLIGYRLTGITAAARKIDPDTGLWVDVELRNHDLLRISTMLSAAAQFVMIKRNALNVGANYLCAEATNTASTPMNTGAKVHSSQAQENIHVVRSDYIVVGG